MKSAADKTAMHVTNTYDDCIQRNLQQCSVTSCSDKMSVGRSAWPIGVALLFYRHGWSLLLLARKSVRRQRHHAVGSVATLPAQCIHETSQLNAMARCWTRPLQPPQDLLLLPAPADIDTAVKVHRAVRVETRLA